MRSLAVGAVIAFVCACSRTAPPTTDAGVEASVDADVADPVVLGPHEARGRFAAGRAIERAAWASPHSGRTPVGMWTIENTSDPLNSEVAFTSEDGTTRETVARGVQMGTIVGPADNEVVYTTFCGLGLTQECIMHASRGDAGAAKKIGVVTHDGGASVFDADEDAVYFVDRRKTGLAVVRLPFGGGPPKTLATAPFADGGSQASAISVDGRSVYVVIDYVISRVPIGGGDLATVATMRALGHLESNTLGLYFSEGLHGDAIRRVPANGGAITELVKHAAGHPIDLRLDGGFVWWVSGNETNNLTSLHRVPITGGKSIDVPDARVGRSLMVTPTHLYWFDDGGIVRAPKLK